MFKYTCNFNLSTPIYLLCTCDSFMTQKGHKNANTQYTIQHNDDKIFNIHAFSVYNSK